MSKKRSEKSRGALYTLATTNYKGKYMNKFTKNKLIKDFKFLVKTFEEVHPDLYACVDEQQKKKEAEEIISQFTDDMTMIDFHNITGKYVASFKDGHTFFYFFNNYIFQQKDYKLFHPFLDFKNSKAFIYKTVEGIVEDGDELLEINGNKVSDMIPEMRKYNSAETDSFRKLLVNGKYLVYFDFLFNIKSPFKIKVERNGKIFETEFEGKSLNELQKERKTKKQNNNKSLKPLFKIEDNIGIFTIKSFGFHKEESNDFKKFFDDSFQEIKSKKISKIIIDVRGNGGGNSSLAGYIAQYLTEKPIYEYDRYLWKSSQQIRDFVKDDVENNTHGYYTKKSYEKLLSVKLGECLEIDSKSDENPFKREQIFKGEVFVLSDGACFSSTTDFIAMIKDFRLGKNVGTQTGGLPNSFGDCYYFDLPNTKLKLSVSHKYFIRPSGNERDNDLTPDFVVSQTDEDKKNGIDTVMEFAKNLSLNKT